jgi:hypothetical protein
LVANQGDFTFFGVERETAGGLNGFGDRQIRGPHDATGFGHPAADVNIGFGGADGNINRGINLFAI